MVRHECAEALGAIAKVWLQDKMTHTVTGYSVKTPNQI